MIEKPGWSVSHAQSSAPQPLKRRLFLVDDHPVTREGMARVISLQPDLQLLGAGPTRGALEQIEKLKPDLVILDLEMTQSPGGLDLIKDLTARQRHLRILVLSTHDESLYAERALRAGARGYVMNHEPIAVILDAVRKVLSGDIYLSPPMKNRLLRRLIEPEPSAWEEIDLLSDREIEVYRLIGEGRGTREIATELSLSISTIESYRAHIKEKLRLDNASALIRHAVAWVFHQSGS